MNFKVLVTSKSFGMMSQEPIRILESNDCKIDWNPYNRLVNDEELSEIIPGYHALLVGDDIVGEKTLNKAYELRVIAKHGIGIDNINVQLATAKGILVTRAPESNSESVADFTFALILGLGRKLVEAVLSARQGLWKPTEFIGIELCGKILGIIGFGSIGRRVARRAMGFDMKTLYYDIRESFKDHDLEKYGAQFAELDDLLRRSDIVTLHVPLTESTRNLIDERELKEMKKTALLINTSRGEVVNETVLCKALKHGEIAGAAIDVYSKEPPGKNFPLFKLKNVVASPHVASYTAESNIRMGTTAAKEIVKVLRGKKPRYSVNPECCI
ncbi:MAG: phosphoglycerate dehydrogenase [Candidatus Hodarchaeota archaeon]